MTAHPKICPRSGELHFFGYDFAPPYLTYHVADAAGTLVTSRVIEVPGATMMHDFNLTERFVVFMDLPAVFDLDLALAGTMPYRFDPSYGARFGVLRRDDPHGVVRWFDIEPCYVFHQMNAHDDGTSITIDAVRHADLWFDGEATPGHLWRWHIDLTAGTVTEQQLDDLPCEFPRVGDRFNSRPARTARVTSTPRHHPDGAERSPCTTSSMLARSASTPSGRNGSPVKQCSLRRTPTKTTAGYSRMCTTHAPTEAISSSSTSTSSRTSRSQPCTFPAEFRSASMARGSRTPQQVTRWTNATLRSPDAILSRTARTSFSAAVRLDTRGKALGETTLKVTWWERYGWTAGIVFIAALIADLIVTSGIPLDQNMSPAKVAAELDQHSTRLIIVACVCVVYAAAFLVYAWKLYCYLRGDPQQESDDCDVGAGRCSPHGGLPRVE